MLFHPNKEKYEKLDARSKEIMQKTIEYFENKGKVELLEDDHKCVWYRDFLDFLKENKIFSTLLTPPEYAIDDPDARWDTYRNSEFSELLGFYGLGYWYTWQVTILGLGPLWMGNNEEMKKKTAQLLKDGGIFGFGLSEKQHGADLYSSDMVLTPLAEGKYVADGGKYYIGNGNEAALLSTFAKNSETDEYVWFAVETTHENYECIKNVVNSQMFVAEYALHSYPITDGEILSTGSEAWDSALNTINVGKFNLGWGSIGIATHAFYEAITHAANRNLYGKYVTEFPHIQQLFTDAYTRLVAMKLFAGRAIDYMRTASAEDRRYLLYNPMVKMKVTTQGEEVINLLWDVIAARGFEKETYFEQAARMIRALPKLEGTVHVNMALIVKFMANYLFNPGEFPKIDPQFGTEHDTFMFNQGPTRGLGKIQFHDYNLAYDTCSLPNAEVFKSQIAALKDLLMNASPTKEQTKDIDFLLNMGELFTLVAYGQLIIENANLKDTDDLLLDQIFDFMVRDFSKHALTLYSKPSSTDAQMEYALKMIKKPVVDNDRFQHVWQKYVLAHKDDYEMKP